MNKDWYYLETGLWIGPKTFWHWTVGHWIILPWGTPKWQNWPKTSQKSQMILKWPQCRKIDFRDRDRSAIILHLDAKIAPNGPNWFQMIPNDPKWSQMIPKWHEYLQIDFRYHLHRNSAPLAVTLSGHMTSLWQIWVWGQKRPQMAKNGLKLSEAARND